MTWKCQTSLTSLEKVCMSSLAIELVNFMIYLIIYKRKSHMRVIITTSTEKEKKLCNSKQIICDSYYCLFRQ